MRSFTSLAILALPLFGTVFCEEPASPTKEVEGTQPKPIYANAQEAFHDLLNALPEESLQAALNGLKDFKDGVFESHHRGVEHVHDKNPALATKLIVAAVQDLKKRQTPSNSTIATPPPPPPSSRPPPVQSSNPPPASSGNPPPASSSDRAVIVNVQQTTVNSQGQTIVQTSSILSQVTASVPVTLVSTNSRGQAVTTTENRPAIIRTMTDAQGRTTVTTSAAQFVPTANEVRTQTDDQGRTFLTTFTPGGEKISSIKLITTIGADGKPSTITTYEFVDPQPTPTQANPGQTTSKPGLQPNAAVANNGAFGYVLAGGALALLV
ncbi:hypothetical protein GQ44DRAFT_711805 [Phaeosphaeriaceae sp. PMI808]|nr:hypothetical protein GQ44DRAFT_711805 [Phaeosphaeriaceae sp. PMI808]